MCQPEINWPKVEHLTKIFRDLLRYDVLQDFATTIKLAWFSDSPGVGDRVGPSENQATIK